MLAKGGGDHGFISDLLKLHLEPCQPLREVEQDEPHRREDVDLTEFRKQHIGFVFQPSASGSSPQSLVADSAYGSAENLAFLVKQRGIAPHIPVFDRSGRTDGALPRSDLAFDAEQDRYTLPSGQAPGAVPSHLCHAALRHHQGRDTSLSGEQARLRWLFPQGQMLPQHPSP
jgi:hypothetical protein